MRSLVLRTQCSLSVPGSAEQPVIGGRVLSWNQRSVDHATFVATVSGSSADTTWQTEIYAITQTDEGLLQAASVANVPIKADAHSVAADRSPIVWLYYHDDTDALHMATRGGQIFTIAADGQVEEFGDDQDGFVAAATSPDEELVIFATGRPLL